jgi:hypothetical protein
MQGRIGLCTSAGYTDPAGANRGRHKLPLRRDFTVQFIDYRDTSNQTGIDLVSALHTRAALRNDLPDPLPEPPPIPYEYLHRLGSSIHNSGVV